MSHGRLSAAPMQVPGRAPGRAAVHWHREHGREIEGGRDGESEGGRAEGTKRERKRVIINPLGKHSLLTSSETF